MSEDNKKSGIKGFFRINTRGEISETKERVEVTNTGQEPSQFDSLKDSDDSYAEKDKQKTEPSSEMPQVDPTIAPINEPLEIGSPLETENEPELNLGFNLDLPDEETSGELNAEVIEQGNQEATHSEHDLPDDFLKNLSQPEAPPVTTGENVDTLRNYISLKEKECEDLKEQQKQYQQVLLKLKRTHAETLNTTKDLQGQLENVKLSESLIKKELSTIKEKHENEIALLKNDFEQEQMKNGSFQTQLSELNRQKTVWKEKISEDLKKIKLKEKELENRYELLKKDTETLLDSKDQQLLALRKKNDALELELEAFEARLLNEHAILNSVESKKRRLIETLKLAISLLESLDTHETPSDERKVG